MVILGEYPLESRITADDNKMDNFSCALIENLRNHVLTLAICFNTMHLRPKFSLFSISTLTI